VERSCGCRGDENGVLPFTKRAEIDGTWVLVGERGELREADEALFWHLACEESR